MKLLWNNTYDFLHITFTSRHVPNPTDPHRCWVAVLLKVTCYKTKWLPLSINLLHHSVANWENGLVEERFCLVKSNNPFAVSLKMLLLVLFIGFMSSCRCIYYTDNTQSIFYTAICNSASLWQTQNVLHNSSLIFYAWLQNIKSMVTRAHTGKQVHSTCILFLFFCNLTAMRKFKWFEAHERKQKLGLPDRQPFGCLWSDCELSRDRHF